jgi:CDP-diacylglycerol--glycerol-3-phosphate 3-phosphatidyltransferase
MSDHSVPLRLIWREVPNAVSVARLWGASVLIAAVTLHQEQIFIWVLLGCLVSDVLDGLIARTFNLSSKLGASLDSIADLATMFAGALGVLIFQKQFVREHYAGLLAVMAFYVVEVLASLWRYGKASSFHTALDRVAASVAGVFVMWLFLFGYQDWLFRITVTVYLIALVEEMVLICMLPEWLSDVGGLHRVLSHKELKPGTPIP